MYAVCASCTHCHMKADDRGREFSTIWYNMFCKKHPKEEVVSPLTGEVAYRDTNDLGTTVYGDDPYDYCRNHNEDGRCRDYDPNVSEEGVDEPSTFNFEREDLDAALDCEEPQPPLTPAIPKVLFHWFVGPFQLVLMRTRIND